MLTYSAQRIFTVDGVSTRLDIELMSTHSELSEPLHLLSTELQVQILLRSELAFDRVVKAEFSVGFPLLVPTVNESIT